jgi:predicted metal-dependent enzyme (double-stranded beta helix superfamily)
VTTGPARFRAFVSDIEALLDATDDETRILSRGAGLLTDLVTHDDWLPEACAQPDPVRYAQHLLHRDRRARFSVVSFVWGPGQSTLPHDHTVWGLVGVLRGAELSQAYRREGGRLAPDGLVRRLGPGEIEAVSPTIGDIHQVSNALNDRVTISIHVYGADIGAVRRATYDAQGRSRTFVSGYSNACVPDLADISGNSQR